MLSSGENSELKNLEAINLTETLQMFLEVVRRQISQRGGGSLPQNHSGLGDFPYGEEEGVCRKSFGNETEQLIPRSGQREQHPWALLLQTRVEIGSSISCLPSPGEKKIPLDQAGSLWR